MPPEKAPPSLFAAAQAQWRRFSREHRPWRQRLLLALGMGFAVAFTFIIFGILDLFITNRGDFPFRLPTILLPVIGLGLAGALLYGLFVALLRGVWFDAALSLTLGLLSAGYAQATFLPNSLGLLTGDSIPWQTLRSQTFLNLAVWLVIGSLPGLLYLFFRPLWKKLLVFLPALLVGMQLAGLVTSCVTTPDLFTSETTYSLSTAGEFEVSSQKNIFVFLLDRLDAQFIDQLLEETPGFLDRLDGFTHYTDYTSEYGYTYPALPVMLTGQPFAYKEITQPGYLKEAWAQATFLPALKQRHFATKAYTDRSIHRGEPELLLGQVDNVQPWQRRLQTKAALTQLVFLSCYRYCPQVLKPFFWQSATAFDRLYTTQPGTASPYELDDALFYRTLSERRLTVQDAQNNFAFYHLWGAHAPYAITAEALPVGAKGGSLIGQLKGVFHILFTFMDQLKELGLYEDATILILGDHGEPHNDFAPRQDAMTVGLLVKESGQAQTPFRRSAAPVSQANFQATVWRAAGIAGGGRAFAEVGEDEEIVRHFYSYYTGDTATGPASFAEFFEIHGRADDFQHWVKIETPEFTQ